MNAWKCKECQYGPCYMQSQNAMSDDVSGFGDCSLIEPTVCPHEQTCVDWVLIEPNVFVCGTECDNLREWLMDEAWDTFPEDLRDQIMALSMVSRGVDYETSTGEIMRKIEFVSYDGKYPNLCSGKLILRINGKKKSFEYCLSSGGGLLPHYEGAYSGDWSFRDRHNQFSEDEIAIIEKLVNENVEKGCCGGCI